MRQTATTTRRNPTVFNSPLNRSQFWSFYICAFVLAVALLMVLEGIIGHADEVVTFLVQIALMIVNGRLLYLRALDVGYRSPGGMMFASLFFVIPLLFVGFRKTGSKLNPQAIAEQAVEGALAA
jgi:uncharacterized membrane protein YhaH (DUF805 family)